MQAGRGVLEFRSRLHYGGFVMLFDDASEYEAEIQVTRKAIRRQLQIGTQHSHNSGDSSRSTSEIDLDKLRGYLSILRRELSMLQGKSSGMIRVTGGF